MHKEKNGLKESVTEWESKTSLEGGGRGGGWRGGIIQHMEKMPIIYNYPPKRRWIVVDMYQPLFTDPEGGSCFSIYQIRWIKNAVLISSSQTFAKRRAIFLSRGILPFGFKSFSINISLFSQTPTLKYLLPQQALTLYLFSALVRNDLYFDVLGSFFTSLNAMKEWKPGSSVIQRMSDKGGTGLTSQNTVHRSFQRKILTQSSLWGQPSIEPILLRCGVLHQILANFSTYKTAILKEKFSFGQVQTFNVKENSREVMDNLIKEDQKGLLPYPVLWKTCLLQHLSQIQLP